ncbi:MAG TPA: TetR/AcrR family transcriptional regulator [Bacteroidia bacterium]|nr:TetR/AcrR family transcriptional regulator [Bacteroidia bacterium]
MAVKKKKSGESAEKKIVEAARKLFTEKGYHAIKTRDIAKEAGINLALLNYYFRSKEKLFEIIVKENISQFMKVIVEIVNDEKTSIETKIEMLVANYIDMLSINPNVPLFLVSHAKQNDQRMKLREKIMESFFMKQIQQAIKSGKIVKIDPTNLMMNIVSLTIFPFVARNVLQNNAGLTSEQFNALMLERKKMIPKWIGAMLKAK